MATHLGLPALAVLFALTSPALTARVAPAREPSEEVEPAPRGASERLQEAAARARKLQRRLLVEARNESFAEAVVQEFEERARRDTAAVHELARKRFFIMLRGMLTAPEVTLTRLTLRELKAVGAYELEALHAEFTAWGRARKAEVNDLDDEVRTLEHLQQRAEGTPHGSAAGDQPAIDGTEAAYLELRALLGHSQGLLEDLLGKLGAVVKRHSIALQEEKERQAARRDRLVHDTASANIALLTRTIDELTRIKDETGAASGLVEAARPAGPGTVELAIGSENGSVPARLQRSHGGAERRGSDKATFAWLACMAVCTALLAAGPCRRRSWRQAREYLPLLG